MRLSEWLKKHRERGTKARLAKAAGVTWQTIHNAARGLTAMQYDHAVKVSEATGGEVTVEDLCSPLPVPGVVDPEAA